MENNFKKAKNLKELKHKNIFYKKGLNINNIALILLVLFLCIHSIWITKNYLPNNLNYIYEQNFDFIKKTISTLFKYPVKLFFILFPFLSVSLVEIIRNSQTDKTSIFKNTSFYRLRKSHGWKFADIWYFLLSIFQSKLPFITLVGTLGIANYYNSYNDYLNQVLNKILPYSFINNNLFLIFIFSILLGDCVSYFSHRLSHKFFWELHEFHHSATEMTMFSFYRNGLLETFTVEAPILPFRVLSIILVTKSLSQGNWSIYTFYIIYNVILQMFIHLGHGSTRIIFPKPISYVFLSPALHWLHHSNNPDHFESNFGTIFSFWDRIFGTYLGEEHLQDIKGYGDPTSEYNKYHPLVCYFVIPFKKLYKKYTLSN